MSKIKVDQIESSDTNVKLAAKGSGVVKLKGAGSVDGTLQLSSGTHSVKIKSPADSAGQSYTMILPDNNITQHSFLKVKSVSGTGVNAIGQLEYATQSGVDKTNLDAANFTTGKIPAARIDSSSLTTTANGYGLKFISKGSVSVDNSVSEITFTNLDADSTYWVLGKNVKTSSNVIYALSMNILDSSNSTINVHGTYYTNSSSHAASQNVLSGINPILALSSPADYGGAKHGFIGEFNTSYAHGFIEAMSYHTGTNFISTHDVNRTKIYFQGANTISGIKFYTTANTSEYFMAGTEILLYKILES